MNGATGERLYGLLPAVYRLRDGDQGEPLRALLGVIEAELQLVEGDIAHLYDNWFIETCDEWVVPYIADLLGVRGLLAGGAQGFTQRGLVANTLAHRQGKGTAATLAQVARDVAGWPATAVESFRRLAATQQLNHLIVDPPATVDLRDVDRLQLIDGPFDGSAHTVDVRHIDNGRGRYNIPSIGIFLWRLQSYPLERVAAAAVATPADGRYTFDPLGRSIPLFNQPRTAAATGPAIAEIDVPAPLRRLPLYEELEARRQTLANGQTPEPAYFGPDPVLQVFVGGNLVPPEQILICDLRDPAPPATDWQRPPAPPPGATSPPVAVDPALGRLAFPAGVSATNVEVSYAYGFSGDLGGGPYNRQDSVAAWLASAGSAPIWQKGVTQAIDDLALDTANLVSTLGAAIQEWNAQAQGTTGIIAVMDSATYEEDLTGQNGVVIHAGSTLLIVAADWPRLQQPETPTQPLRTVGQLSPHDVRPCLRGSLEARGDAAATSINPGAVSINGFLIAGTITVTPGNLGALSLVHSTLVPPAGTLGATAGLAIEQRNDGLTLTVQRSIAGPLTLAAAVQSLQVQDSIVDAGDDAATAINAPAADLQTSSIRGRTIAGSLNAGNSIFTGTVTVTRRQTGCLRYCYVPAGSRTPRRYRCQPADATAAGSIVPRFTSVTCGQPGYAQLAPSNPAAIIAGASDEGEMGAFNFLQQTQRLGSLQTRLGEYLRFALEVGASFST